MVGYTEALTDPSYKSQILTLTFPLVGNYGVPDEKILENGFSKWTESRRIWAAGMIVGENCNVPSHWNMSQTLSKWLQKEGEGNIETNPALLFPTTCVSCPTAKTTCWVINVVLQLKLF